HRVATPPVVGHLSDHVGLAPGVRRKADKESGRCGSVPLIRWALQLNSAAGSPGCQVTRGSRASRRRSPTRLMASTVKRIARPGKVGSHHATLTKSRPSAIIWPQVG